MLAWTMEFAGATGNCPRDGSCAEDEPPRYIDELDPWEWPAVARGRPGAFRCDPPAAFSGRVGDFHEDQITACLGRDAATIVTTVRRGEEYVDG